MIGTFDTSKKEAVIIGAGISGLLIGYKLKKLDYKITIFEKSSRAGGLIQTRHTSHGIAESAAHSLMVNEPVQEFLTDLGIELLPVNQKSTARYIVRHGKMKRLPLTFFEIISTLRRFFSRPKLSNQVITLEEWCLSYLGKPALDYLLSPFVTGIFACSPAELNAKLAFPKLIPSLNQSLYQHMKSLKKGTARPKMMVPKFGMQSLVDALAEHLKEEIKYNVEINAIPASPNVVFCLPAPALEKVLNISLPTVSYAPLITVTVFFQNSAFKNSVPSGVGVLIPRSENFRALGILFNSASFQFRTFSGAVSSFTFMFGGTSDPSALQLTDQDLKIEINKAAKQLLGCVEDPLHLEICRWPNAIPLYSNGLAEGIDFLNKTVCNKPGKVIFSNYSGQVSIRGMIETIVNL